MSDVTNIHTQKTRFFSRNDVSANPKSDSDIFYIDIKRFGLNKRVYGDTPYDTVNNANSFLRQEMDK